MTGEEKRRILKEQYKKDLLERKAFLEKAKKLRKMQRINQALSEMESAMQDDSDEWINKLNQESALSEAKMELLMDAALEKSDQEKIDEVKMQAEMAKKSAEDLVRKMKRELGLLAEEEAKPAAGEETAPQKPKEEVSEGPSKVDDTKLPKKDPGKTLGDF